MQLTKWADKVPYLLLLKFSMSCLINNYLDRSFLASPSDSSSRMIHGFSTFLSIQLTEMLNSSIRDSNSGILKLRCSLAHQNKNVWPFGIDIPIPAKNKSRYDYFVTYNLLLINFKIGFYSTTKK